MFERFTDRPAPWSCWRRSRRAACRTTTSAPSTSCSGCSPRGTASRRRSSKRRASRSMPRAADVVRIVGSSAEAPSGSIQFTPRAKTVLERSLRESLQPRSRPHRHRAHPPRDPRRRRWAREPDPRVARLLARDRPRRRPARDRIDARCVAVGPPAGGAVGGSVKASRASRTRRRRWSRSTSRAREFAGHGPISSGHILRALVADPDSQAARALASLGVSAERIEGALAATSTEGTTDETPEARSRASRASSTDGGPCRDQHRGSRSRQAAGGWRRRAHRRRSRKRSTSCGPASSERRARRRTAGGASMEE